MTPKEALQRDLAILEEAASLLRQELDPACIPTPAPRHGNDYYLQYLAALDDPRIAMTDTDIDFLDSLLTKMPDHLSPKQRAWLGDMVRRYLGEELEL